MKPSKKKGGIGRTLFNGVWILLCAGVLLAAFRLTGWTSLGDVWDWAKAGSQDVENCYKGDCNLTLNPGQPTPGPEIDLPEGGITDKDLGYRGPEFGDGYVLPSVKVTKDYALSSLAQIPVADSVRDGYDRSEWKHWAPYGDRSCWTVRKEVLYQQAVPGTAQLTDKNKEPTEDYSQACNIVGGTWIDAFSGKKITDPSKIDIDHLIPLSYAARNGAQSWGAEEKQTFANDVDLVLLAVSASENRKKGDKGPSEYMPPDKSYQCAYAKNFTLIAYEYGLSLPQEDVDVLTETINTKCAA